MAPFRLALSMACILGSLIPTGLCVSSEFPLDRLARPLDHRLAMSESTLSLQGQVHYQLPPPIVEKPLLGPPKPGKAPEEIFAIGLAGGILGGLSGALLGSGSGTSLDQSWIATGAFLGWGIGSTLGMEANRDHPEVHGLAATLFFTSMGALAVRWADREELYVPFAVLQFAVAVGIHSERVPPRPDSHDRLAVSGPPAFGPK